MTTATNLATDTKTKVGKVEDKAAHFTNDLKNAAAAAAEAAAAKDTTLSLTDRAKDMASAAAETAGNVATAVGHTARDAASAVGNTIGNAGSAVAGAVESGGRFLKDQGVSAAEDITALIRRNPIPAVLISIAAGYVLARAIHRS
jgi:hypothetical protein